MLIELKFVKAESDPPVYIPSVGGGPETELRGEFEMRELDITDGRSWGADGVGGFGLDDEGFALVRHDSNVRDFHNSDQLSNLYDRELEGLVRLHTGAARVHVFDHTLRTDDPDTRAARDIREPASVVHNDYTARSALTRLKNMLGVEAEALSARRFAIINVWRSIAGPVMTTPLAVCDAASVANDDLVTVERRAEHRIGEIYMAKFNPDQRWVWFSGMQIDEALLIKTYDSDTSDGRACLCVHTAFRNPEAAKDAEPRQSIESRCFAFF